MIHRCAECGAIHHPTFTGWETDESGVRWQVVRSVKCGHVLSRRVWPFAEAAP